MKRKVILIGAGPAGLTAAYRLVSQGFDVHVLESGLGPGGLSRSFDLWGQTVDLGPHRFFSTDAEIVRFWQEALDGEYVTIPRLTRIFYRRRFLFYPLRAFNILQTLGCFEALRCVVSFLRAQFFKRPSPRNFEEWIVGKFGRRLFNTFFKTYTEKLWGIPCTQLDTDWAQQRIRQMSFTKAVAGAFFKKTRGAHRSMVDEFSYPVGGTGRVYEKLAAKIVAAGGVVEYGAPVAKILSDAEKRAIGVELVDGRKFQAEAVISTMPLTLMVQKMAAAPPEVIEACRRLRYRNTILVYVEIDRGDLFPDNWIYMHEPNVLHGRITNFRNWDKSLTGSRSSTILCMEYWCFDDDEIWRRSDDELRELALRELRVVDLLPREARCLNSHVEKIPRSYPVYQAGYKIQLAALRNFLDGYQNLYAIGRNGSFKYNNQDHSILMGLLAARSLTTGVRENLWDINETQQYQEEK